MKKTKSRAPDVFDVRAQCEQGCLVVAENCEAAVEYSSDDCDGNFKFCRGECQDLVVYNGAPVIREMISR